MTVTEGPKKSATTRQLDELGIMLDNDIRMIEAAVGDCILSYQSAVDIDGDGDKDTTDNPNAPFPVIYDSTTGYAASGDIAKAICPGWPPTPLTPPATASRRQLLVSPLAGRAFKVLGDTTRYTTLYNTDTTEGVYLRITRASANALWTEALARLDARMSECKMAIVTAPGVCVNGCLYYWIRRLPGSVLGPEAGCP
jgi:hypothetical protein